MPFYSIKICLKCFKYFKIKWLANTQNKTKFDKKELACQFGKVKVYTIE